MRRRRPFIINHGLWDATGARVRHSFSRWANTRCSPAGLLFPLLLLSLLLLFTTRLQLAGQQTEEASREHNQGKGMCAK